MPAQTPPGPLGAPRTQTPDTPRVRVAQTPTRPYEGPLQTEYDGDDGDDPPRQFTLDVVDSIETGMSYQDIHDLLGAPGVVISGTDSNNQVYRWSHPGLSFMGRFTDGVLTRKQIIDLGDDRKEALDEEVLHFDRALYDSIVTGMTYDEVMEAINVDAQPLSRSAPQGDQNVVIYMWTDGHGSNITGRFENQVLTRKSGMIRDLDVIADEDQDEWQEDILDNGRTEEVPEPPTYHEEDAPLARETTPPAPPASPTVTSPDPRPGRVHVAGVTRRERETAHDPSPHAGRSYRPRVRFPEFTRRLRRGVYEIRIHNTTETGVRVAVISEEGGLEFGIPAGGRNSAHVNQGVYHIYFIYNDDPYSLHRGQSIPVSEALADFSVFIIGNTYDVRYLDRTHEPPEPSSRRR